MDTASWDRAKVRIITKMDTIIMVSRIAVIALV